MYFKYGNFQHDINLVDLESFTQRTVQGNRGQRTRIVKTMTLSGDLIPSTASQAAIRSKIQTLENAYNFDGEDAGLFHDDGTPSPHFLPSAQSINGVVVKSLDYPQGDNPRRGEYVTARKFRIVLEAEYLQSQTDHLLSYGESISIQGNGGPKRVVTEVDYGAPITEITRQRTKVTIRQQGQAVGYLSTPAPNPPMFPEYMSGEVPVIVPGTPTSQNRNRWTEYPISWSYTFVLPEYPGIVYPLVR